MTVRSSLVRQALMLEMASLCWMLAEPIVAVASAVAAHSIALLAFGLDGVIELASAAALTWRFSIEALHGEDLGRKAETRARKLAAVLLCMLAAYVVVAALRGLAEGHAEVFSLPGFLVALVEIPVMYALASGKMRLSRMLASSALRADAVATTSCTYLAGAVLIGMAGQRLAGAWWIDGATSLVIAFFLIREALVAWGSAG